MVALFKHTYTPPQMVRRPLPYTLHHGDCLDVLRTLPDNSIDAVVTDPPSGIAFMGKQWDKDKGGRDAWIAWLSDVMAEVLRVLKPGGHAFVWALPRTSHWTACALEDAGFDIREKHYHLFGSGFPKSHDISKAIDRERGAERETVRTAITKHTTAGKGFSNEIDVRPWMIRARANGYHEHASDIPATPDAERWQGWGTATKPAVEEWILARKPLAEPTVAANVLAYGTGGLNIDASRINPGSPVPGGGSSWGKSSGTHEGWKRPAHEHYGPSQPHTEGRWPANLLLSHTPECRRVGTKRVSANRWGKDTPHISKGESAMFGNGKPGVATSGYEDSDGMETIESWECSMWCPVRILDEQSGNRKSGGGIKSKAGHSIGLLRGEDAYHFQHDGIPCEPSEGGASRFFQTFQPSPDDRPPYFYCAKASRAERNRGCEGLPEGASSRYGTMRGTAEHGPKYDTPEKNSHPTVKPINLMKYLVRLITPPGGTVLDPFMGSGTTGVAAVEQGFRFVGIEQEAEYLAIAEARLAHGLMEVQA